MGKTATVESVPFTNEFGQTIQPGEEVIYATHSTGFLGIRKGKYVGRLLSGRVRIEDLFTMKIPFKKGTDVKFEFYRDFLNSYENTIPSPKPWPGYYNPAYEQEVIDVSARRQELFESLVEYREKLFVYKTTLWNNRIFKAQA